MQTKCSGPVIKVHSIAPLTVRVASVWLSDSKGVAESRKDQGKRFALKLSVLW